MSRTGAEQPSTALAARPAGVLSEAPTATPPEPTGDTPQDDDATAHAEGEPADEGELCASIFRGLVFFLAREVPQEALLLVIRAFGGTAGWQGAGSPFGEQDEAITHQVRLCACTGRCTGRSDGRPLCHAVERHHPAAAESSCWGRVPVPAGCRKMLL